MSLARFASINSPWSRALLYLLVAATLGTAGYLLAERQAFLRGATINFVVSDGRGYYAYLPAVVIDHTLDVSNQYCNHWGEDFTPQLLEHRTERGYAIDKYPIGLALTLCPAFVGAHAGACIAYARTGEARFTPDGYSPVYQVTLYVFILALGLATMLLIDRALVRHLGCHPAAAMGAVLAFWAGSHYSWYYFREPMMAHIVSTFWVTLSICLSLRLMDDADAGQLRKALVPALGFAACMAIVCRPTNLFIVPVLGLAAWKLARRRSAAGGRSGQILLWEAIFHTPWFLGLIPLLLQLGLWRWTSGHWLFYSYGEEGFYWSRPALCKTLFSTKHGLFVWSPLLLLSALGMIWRWRQLGQVRGAVAALLLSAGGLWYLNSAWHCWWFGWAFGARAFLELALLFTFGLACAFEHVGSARPGFRRAVIYAVAVAVLYNYVLMSLYAAGSIPREGYWF